MSETVKALRYLCSCDAEAMSDYLRINYFVKHGLDAVSQVEALYVEREMLRDHIDWLERRLKSEPETITIPGNVDDYDRGYDQGFRDGLESSADVLLENLAAYDEDVEDVRRGYEGGEGDHVVAGEPEQHGKFGC